MYKRKSRGPNIEPWGTPNLTNIGEQKTSPNCVNCDLENSQEL